MLYQNGMGTKELASRVLHLAGKGLVIGDSASPRTIQDLKQVGVNIIPASKNKVTDDIKAMSDYKFIIQGSNLAMELNTWVWLDKRGDVPLDGNNHLIDPARYAFNHLTKNKPRGIKKSTLC
jgi:phage terminase large subunit